ncbi:hypothetical protein [Petrachloros mirabilis]
MVHLDYASLKWFMGLAFCVVLLAALTSEADAARAKKKSKTASSQAATVALQYAEALSKADIATVAKLDFACQYRLVAATKAGLKSYPDPSDPSYEACWQGIKAANKPALVRSDVGMYTLWPSKGALAYFGEELHKYPTSAFVMDEIGLSPPGSGLHIKAGSSARLKAASFRPREGAPVVSTPATLVTMTVTYQDALLAPVTKAPGSYTLTNTIKPAKRSLKSIDLQWVVLTGLKRHGFPGDAAVVNLLVKDGAPINGVPQEVLPFVTDSSKAIPDSLSWWTPEDSPGMLIAAAARAAGFPDLRDRVALLNRVLTIDPDQPEGLNVLTKDLYAAILRDAMPAHNLSVKDPALSMVVNEHYWNTYSQAIRMNISLGMEIGGFEKPTTADYLFRVLPALKALARVRPEQLDNRFRWGVALRWNNDFELSTEVHENLVKEIPNNRKSGKAEALLQLAWDRVNKLAWNRNYDDPDVKIAYQNADDALKYAEIPLDKFLAEYTKAFSLLYEPHRNHKAIFERLSEARRWFNEVPGQTDEIWNFFIGADQMKMILDADPIFQPLMVSTSAPKG